MNLVRKDMFFRFLTVKMVLKITSGIAYIHMFIKNEPYADHRRAVHVRRDTNLLCLTAHQLGERLCVH